MKTKLFSAIAVAAMALGMAACSSSDDLSNDNGQATGTNTGYLRVNVREMNTVGGFGAKKAITRADDQYPNDYADGEGDESFVGKVRFYFFDANGNPFALSNSTPVGQNFLNYDFTNIAQNDPNNATVEDTTASVLVISSQNPDAFPQKVVAVVNYDALSDGVLGDASKSLPELQTSLAQTTNFLAASTNDNHNNHFVMSSSVYMNQWPNPSQINIAEEIGDHVKKTRSDAQKSPVDIYVERLAAKVTVGGNNVPTTAQNPTDGKWGLVNNQPAYAVDTITTYRTDAAGNRTETNNVFIRALVQGWGFADAARNGKVFKDISTYASWWNQLGPLTNNDQNTDPRWNSSDYKRSFWEVTSDYHRTNYSWSSMTTGFGANGYTMPNTPDEKVASADALNRRTAVNNPNAKDLTKVVVAAKLQYSTDGNSWQDANLYRYNGRYYLDEASVKNEVALLYGKSYRKYNDVDTVAISADDVALDTATAIGQTSDYKLRIKLKDGGTYFNITGKELTGNERYIGSAANYALHYNGGDTYYYTTIQHIWGAGKPANLADDYLGYYGVVRNHWYRVTINSLVGPGTPVPDPNKPIIPITPEESISYLNARINVLQWRLVNQSVDIDGSTKQQTSTTTASAKKH